MMDWIDNLQTPLRNNHLRRARSAQSPLRHLGAPTQVDLNALIRSAIYALRAADFTSFVYSMRRCHWMRRGIASSGKFENTRDRHGAK
jgi:hypothetical protein